MQTAVESFRQAGVGDQEMAHAVAVEDQIMKVLQDYRRYPLSPGAVEIIGQRIHHALDEWRQVAALIRQQRCRDSNSL